MSNTTNSVSDPETLQFHMSMPDSDSAIVALPTNQNLPPSQQNPDESSESLLFHMSMPGSNSTIDEPSQEITPTSSIAVALPSDQHLPLERLQEINTWINLPINPFDLPETSEQNPIVPSTSDENPDENNRSFSFQLKPARILKRAIHVLCDSEINEFGLADIHVDENGFEITVDSKGGTIGLLSLSPSGLINFQCCKPVKEAQVVCLTMISQKLTRVDDEDTVTVYQVDGSTKLMFESTVSLREFSVEFFSTNNNIRKVPKITLYCEAVILSRDLRHMIQQWSQPVAEKPQVASVEIENNEVTFHLTDEETLRNDFSRLRFSGTRGKAPGQHYRAWFFWTFAKALEKASHLQTELRVCFSSRSTRDVVFQFNLKELGDLLILKRTLAIYPDVDHVD